MPFKRAVVLLLSGIPLVGAWLKFQCPLSGQLCCCDDKRFAKLLRKVSMPFKRAVVLLCRGAWHELRRLTVSMPFKRAVVLLLP